VVRVHRRRPVAGPEDEPRRLELQRAPSLERLDDVGPERPVARAGVLVGLVLVEIEPAALEIDPSRRGLRSAVAPLEDLRLVLPTALAREEAEEHATPHRRPLPLLVAHVAGE